MSIKGKLWGIAICMFLVIGGMMGVTFVRTTSVVLGQMQSTGAESVRRAADNINIQFMSLEAVLRNATAAVEYNWKTHGSDASEKVIPLMTSLTQKNKAHGVTDIYTGFEADGWFADGTGWVPDKGYDARTRSWYKEAVAAKGPIVTSPYLDGITKQIIISMTMPAYGDGGKLLGVVGIDIDLGWLSEFVGGLNILGAGSGLLLTKEGVLAAGPAAFKEQVMKGNVVSDESFPEGLRAVASLMIAGREGRTSLTMLGEEQEFFYAPTKAGLPIAVFFPRSVISEIRRSITMTLLFIAVSAFFVVGTVIFFITRNLNRSVSAMSAVTDRLAQGDFSVSYRIRGRDELAVISSHLNSMIESLRGVLLSVRGEAQETAQRAETLASLSEETVASMEEVGASISRVMELAESGAAALEETNASVEEIASSASSAANSATEGAESAAFASSTTDASVEDVEGFITSVKGAAAESGRSVERIRELGKSVEAISGFVATITSIADQTNLLALNAAIEAARAGEAGRGFAVVAEEVRKLAEDSARAASNVNKLIADLQRHSSESIDATRATGDILDEAVKRAAQTQKKLEETVGAIAKVAEAVQNIAAVSEEQAASSQEMTTAIRSVTDTTNSMVGAVGAIKTSSGETTKAAEHIALEAQSMSQAAETLLGLVNRFSVDEHERSLPAKTEQISAKRG